MIDERQEQLASLYALDLLEGAERAQFEAALATDLELRQLVAGLRNSAASLAHTAAGIEPSSALKQRLLATIKRWPRTPPLRESVVVAGPFRGVLPWTIAAGFAAATVWFGGRYLAFRNENALLKQQTELAQLTLKASHAQIEVEHLLATRVAQKYQVLKTESDRQLADAAAREAHAQAELAGLTKRGEGEANLAQLKIATLVSMQHESAGALAVAVWDSLHQQGVLSVDQLPPTPPDRRYELWVIDGKPVSAGVFTVGADGHARLEFKPVAPITKASKFAVSREMNDGLTSHASPAEVIMMSE